MYRKSIISEDNSACRLRRIVVSNWELYKSVHKEADMEIYTDFLAGIAAGHRTCLKGKEKPDILIVREKQLPESEYLKLFINLWQKCQKVECSKTVIIPHTYPAAAKQTGCGWIHLPFSLFIEYQKCGMVSDLNVGTSIHSVKEAETAQELGAAYVTAGHIFTTDCKKNAAPRGLEFLDEVCAAVDIPVYAIGGIHMEQLPLVYKSRAAGACMMSEYVIL